MIIVSFLESTIIMQICLIQKNNISIPDLSNDFSRGPTNDNSLFFTAFNSEHSEGGRPELPVVSAMRSSRSARVLGQQKWRKNFEDHDGPMEEDGQKMTQFYGVNFPQIFAILFFWEKKLFFFRNLFSKYFTVNLVHFFLVKITTKFYFVCFGDKNYFLEFIVAFNKEYICFQNIFTHFFTVTITSWFIAYFKKKKIVFLTMLS